MQGTPLVVGLAGREQFALSLSRCSTTRSVRPSGDGQLRTVRHADRSRRPHGPTDISSGGRLEVDFPAGFLDSGTGGQEVHFGHLQLVTRPAGTAAERGPGAGNDGSQFVIAVCTAVNSAPGSFTLLSRLDLCPGGE